LDYGTVIGFRATDGKAIALDLGATDGTEIAAGVMLTKATADGVDVPGLALLRLGIVRRSGLVWPGGITAEQQLAAISQLDQRLIITQ
jgi:hypothetical protein